MSCVFEHFFICHPFSYRLHFSSIRLMLPLRLRNLDRRRASFEGQFEGIRDQLRVEMSLKIDFSPSFYGF